MTDYTRFGTTVSWADNEGGLASISLGAAEATLETGWMIVHQANISAVGAEVVSPDLQHFVGDAEVIKCVVLLERPVVGTDVKVTATLPDSTELAGVSTVSHIGNLADNSLLPFCVLHLSCLGFIAESAFNPISITCHAGTAKVTLILVV